MNQNTITEQIFLSHTLKDVSFANYLSKQLQLRGFNVWNDECIEAGGAWEEHVKEGLMESDSMIALLTQHSFSSSYVRYELEYVFFDNRYKNRILPVLIESTPDDNFVRLPWVLTKMVFLRLPDELLLDEMVERIIDNFINLLTNQGG